jgi:hypothetical protein
LKEVVDRRSLEIRNAAYLGEEPPPVSASTLAAVELIKSARLTGARDAVVESETGGAATKPYPKVFESAVYAWQAKQTLAVDDDAYLMNVLVDYDALRDENEKLKSQNQGLQLQNETLQLEVTALHSASSKRGNEPVVNMSEFAEQFVRDPEMRRGGLMALYVKHINFGDAGATDTSAGGEPSASTQARFENQNHKRKQDFAEFGADPQPPRPGPACETTDFRQRVVRNARYLGRFLALLAVIALFALSMYNQKVYSTRVYCENDEVILNAALRQGLQVADLFHFKAGMDCHEKVQATMAVYAVILIAWHVLCIEAWMGFRFVRAMLLMWRWDVKSRAAAKRNAALACELGEKNPRNRHRRRNRVKLRNEFHLEFVQRLGAGRRLTGGFRITGRGIGVVFILITLYNRSTRQPLRPVPSRKSKTTTAFGQQAVKSRMKESL